MHKLAYAEFSQDGGRLLKFAKHFRKFSEQLNAMDKQLPLSFNEHYLHLAETCYLN
jgi:hypothetical protein